MPKPNAGPAALRRILTQELALGRRLIALAEQETDALIAGEVAALTGLSAEQARCQEQQETLEAARMSLTRGLALTLGLEAPPTLSALLPLLPPREQEPLAQLRAHLLAVQERLTALNARNRHLLEQAMEVAQFSLDMLTNAALRPARYGTNIASIAAPTFYVDSKA